MKVQRSTEKTFCDYCKEPLVLGRHAIPMDLAKTLPKEKCGKCQTESLVSCILGLGHFVYVCEKCGHRWSNIQ